jgi:hypothetical protein
MYVENYMAERTGMESYESTKLVLNDINIIQAQW